MNDGPARRLAAMLERRGLREPARLFADAHRPLGPLLADLAAAYGPLVQPFAVRPLEDVAALLDDPNGLERLAAELATEPSRGRRAESG